MQPLIAALLIPLGQPIMPPGDHAPDRQHTQRSVEKSRVTAKIWVFSDGEIELNAAKVDLEEVRRVLSELAKRDGVVLYGRDAADRPPHGNALKVIELVVENRLALVFSAKRDFSDVE